MFLLGWGIKGAHVECVMGSEDFGMADRVSELEIILAQSI